MKQPNWKTPLLLSAALITLSSFAYWLQYSHKPKTERAETSLKKPLPIFSEEKSASKKDAKKDKETEPQIATLKIKNAHGLIEFKCDSLAQKKCGLDSSGSTWTITHPQKFLADADSVKEVIRETTSLVATETIDLQEETPEKRKKLLEEYGLSDAQRTEAQSQFLEAVLEDGTRMTVWLGQTHPLGDKIFVASAKNGTLNDQTFFLINGYFKSTLDHDVAHFRDKTLFTFDRNTIESFDAKTKNGALSGKKTNGFWTINGNTGDYENIETVIASIAQLKAKNFPTTDFTRGLNPILNYALRGKQVHTLAIYEKITRDPKAQNKEAVKTYFAKTSAKPEAVEIEPTFRTQIEKSLNDLRQRRILLDTEKATATRLKIEGTAYPQAADFSFEGGKWVQKSPVDPKLDIANVPKILDLFASTRIDNFVSLQNRAQKSITMSIGDDKNPIKFKLKFWHEKNRLYAQDLNQKKNEALVMEDAIKNALPFQQDSWKIK